MTKAPPRQTRIHSIASCTQKTLLPLVAVGGSLAAAPGNALELGDAIVQSRLGQPLRASIAFALAPNEKLNETCIALSQGQSPSGLPGIGRATISIADGALLLQGITPIREPMVATNVVVKCPSAANLSREYMMFIDPLGIETNAQPAAQTNPVSNTTSASAAATQPTAVAPAAAARQPQRAASRRSSVTRTTNRTPVGQATRYQVQPGDSLSEITQRIENRTMGLWPAVNMIFEANPDAFIDNDPNKLKAGSWLSIPSFDGSQPVVATVRDEAAPVAVAETQPAEMATAAESIAPQWPVESAVSDAGDQIADFTTDLQPANTAADNTVVTTAENETISIPDVELDGPQTSSTSPNVITAVVDTAATDGASPSWMLWLAGVGVAVILALLLFGRSLRHRLSPAPFRDDAELPAPVNPRQHEPEPDGIEVIERVDWNLGDDAPTVENPVLDLDADLLMGTGLGDATEDNVVDEIGFPAPTQVDIELPLEPDVSDDLSETDVLSPTVSDEYHITVETEELPDDEEYDLSVIMDATKMPRPDDDDHPELETIEVEPIDETVLLNDNTVDPSIDFDILAQDYEDEFSATQALNMDTTRAALMLDAQMEADKPKAQPSGLDDDETAAMSLASVTDLDLATPEKDGVAANDDATTELSLDEPTVEMPSIDDDKTEIMSRKRRKIDSKAG